MGVYEILILPGGREGGRAKGSESLERECEVTLLALARAAAKPTLDEGGRGVKPPLFASLSLICSLLMIGALRGSGLFSCLP